METPEPSDTTRASKQVSKLKEKHDPDNFEYVSYFET